MNRVQQSQEKVTLIVCARLFQGCDSQTQVSYYNHEQDTKPDRTMLPDPPIADDLTGNDLAGREAANAI